MAHYVLIVIFGFYYGSGVTFQDFNTLEGCNKAKQLIVNQIGNEKFSPHLYCVAKD